ncbi:uncharacterized protein LOC122511431 isoform X2 [Leptopilina heterotoma]|uniref:uncharacterized protein LOC122511431 isoform X2 n=1 Tax=Leptopilina heterotoma TaxID=63436 RepID=UPI001CAA33CD|nr:uncharacterized protein LOC122511431 isoform X2 [Leptopilina heterotoma]
MIRILIICLLTALVKSRNCQLDHRSLKKLKSSVDETKDFLNNDLDSRSAIVFFGNAKSGKSTLVNYLIPNELTAVRDKYGSLTIQRNGPNSTGPIIGTSSTSYTKIPKKWSSKTFTEFSLWDLPGFEDNRGVSQKVLNSFYIKELLTKVKIAKIVLVVDHETFNEPYTHFFNLIEWVSTFFGDKFENIFESISVILTKVPHSSNEGNVDSSYTHQVMTKLQGNLKNMPDGQSKRFVEYLVKNENRIGLFMAPNKEGTVGEECDINIKEAINNSQNISNGILDTIKLSLDAESKSCLLSSLNQKHWRETKRKNQN